MYLVVLTSFLSSLSNSSETYLELKLTWPLEPLKGKHFHIFRSVLRIVFVVNLHPNKLTGQCNQVVSTAIITGMPHDQISKMDLVTKQWLKKI